MRLVVPPLSQGSANVKRLGVRVYMNARAPGFAEISGSEVRVRVRYVSLTREPTLHNLCSFLLSCV